MASRADACDFTMRGPYGASSPQETGDADMAQPLDAMLALTQANMRLALKLAETWRESGQTIIEIGGRGASEVAEETRLAISKRAEGGTVSLPNTGHLQDYLGELESLRVATAEKVEEAVADWRSSLSSTVTSSLNAKGATPFDTLFKPWLTALQGGGTTEKPDATKRGK
ncbi:hypothetical protein PX699_16375 [Sphingobium sp. H39-3-25]|uniref:hypothetical protein n=1 Tax=Sphingobium arseniciresistens TaxID=3030834 RepID=UPI0023B8AB2D|nr:hypothetical protein [Sphingobium arseniciresistens]